MKNPELNFLKTPETNPLLFEQKLTEINQSKHTAIEIKTVGSKDKNKVAATAVINHEVFKRGDDIHS